MVLRFSGGVLGKPRSQLEAPRASLKARWNDVGGRIGPSAVVASHLGFHIGLYSAMLKPSGATLDVPAPRKLPSEFSWEGRGEGRGPPGEQWGIQTSWYAAPPAPEGGWRFPPQD